MRVFVSSLMGAHFTSLREAADKGIGALGFESVMAEDYTVSPSSPEAACLEGVRSSDAVVLVLGSEYGDCQASELSATHQEYREAREESIPVLAFIEEGAEPTEDQAVFVREVRDWAQGQYTESFSSPDDLQAKVTRGLYRHSINEARAPVDGEEVVGRARALIPEHTHTGQAQLFVGVAGGPARQVLRPSELEAEELRSFLLREALTGPVPVLDLSSGTDSLIRGDALVVSQRDSGTGVSLSETGSIVVIQPAVDYGGLPTSTPSVIEDEVAERIELGLRFSGLVLDHVDPQERISRVGVVAAVLGAGYLPWRTREEQFQNPHTATMSSFSQDWVQAELAPPTFLRAALLRDAQRLSEDLAVRLRRQATEGPYR